MASTKSALACVLVDRAELTVYRSDREAPIRLRFPREVVDAIDVVDDDELVALLGKALAGDHPPTETLIIFLDATCFLKDVTLDPKDKEKDISPESDSAFVSLVPFETTFARRYDIGNKTYLAVINADMFYTLKMGLEQNGYTVAGVVPEILMGDKDRAFTLNSTAGFKEILKKFEYLKKNSFSTTESSDETGASSDVTAGSDSMERALTAGQTRQNRSLLPIAVPVLLILLCVLGFVLYQQFTTPSTAAQVSNETDQPPTRPVAAVSASPEPTAAGRGKSEITIRVLNGSGRAGDANRVRGALQEADFTNITTGNADVPNRRETQIVFTGSIQPAVRDELRALMENLEGELDIREQATGEANVIILTGSRSGIPTQAAQPTTVPSQ